MKKITILFILIHISVYTHVALSQVFTDVEPPTPRFGAIGATSALAGDPSHVFQNPAALVTIQSLCASAAFTRPYQQNFYTLYHSNFAMPLPKSYGVGGIGLLNGGVKYANVSLSNETALALSHAFYLQRDIQTSLAFGYTLKYYSQSFGTSMNGHALGSNQAFGIDAGVYGLLWQRTAVGFHVTNLNRPTMGSVVENELPSVVRGTIGYSPYRGVYTGIELERTLGGNQIVKAGSEFEINPYLDIRLGIRSNPNRVALGFGLKNFSKLRMDYTFVSHPSLAATHLVGISYGF
ncbi:MAG: hypothetical protein N2450_00870 [bacterium]|nr:hypothetical protein [bacterium]